MSIILEKSYSFAIHIIKLYKVMVNERKEYVLSKQVLRSGTAVGTLIREGEHAQSRADSLKKMNIALKEANDIILAIPIKIQRLYFSCRIRKNFSTRTRNS